MLYTYIYVNKDIEDGLKDHTRVEALGVEAEL